MNDDGPWWRSHGLDPRIRRVLTDAQLQAPLFHCTRSTVVDLIVDKGLLPRSRMRAWIDYIPRQVVGAFREELLDSHVVLSFSPLPMWCAKDGRAVIEFRMAAAGRPGAFWVTGDAARGWRDFSPDDCIRDPSVLARFASAGGGTDRAAEVWISGPLPADFIRRIHLPDTRPWYVDRIRRAIERAHLDITLELGR